MLRNVPGTINPPLYDSIHLTIHLSIATVGSPTPPLLLLLSPQEALTASGFSVRRMNTYNTSGVEKV